MFAIKKLKQFFHILGLTNYKFFRASQLASKNVIYNINGIKQPVHGKFALTMLLEIVAEDVYHLKRKNAPKVICDVGANIGIFSLHAATLFPDCMVYAFEPFSDNYELLMENTKNLKNVICINKAVSNACGIAYIEQNDNHTAVHISNASKKGVAQSVEAITIESFLYERGLPSIDILKLDCEGSEYEIAETALKNVKEITGEFHSTNAYKPGRLKQLLYKQNFTIKRWKGFKDDSSGLFIAIRN